MDRQAVIGIVGAGIGGMTLGAALARQGIAFRIYEQAPVFGPVGAGIQLTANAMKGLQGLGIGDGLATQGFSPEFGLNRQWDTGVVTNRLEMGESLRALYGAPDVALHRAKLHGALAALVPAANIRLNHSLVGIDMAGDRIELRFADGSTDTVDAVVGADGLHSAVRRIVVGEEKPSYTGKVAYRAVLPTREIQYAEVDQRVKWWGPDRHIVSYFTTGERDQTYFIAVLPEPGYEGESWSAVGDRTALLREFEGFHPQARAILEAGGDIRKWGLFDRDPLARWSHGSITLLGDACHPMPPFIAQGAASSIEDAIVLSRAISGAADGDLAAAFSRYESARHDRTSLMQRTARENKWMQTKVDASWVYGYDAWTAPLGGIN